MLNAPPAALRALLDEILDYAGLFPPAKLPLDRAVAEYAQRRTSAQAWMLARFVCPVARLGELTELARPHRGRDGAWRVCALGSGGKDAAAFEAALRRDAGLMVQAYRDSGRMLVPDVLEVRLPDDWAGSLQAEAVAHLAAEAVVMFDRFAAIGAPVRVFFEVPLAGDWRQAVTTAAQGLSAANARLEASRPPAGFKLRTGGVQADAFPSAGQIAAVLAACRDARVPLKATAGLHHPIRRHEESVGTTMHGFLNLFVGAALAWSAGLGERELIELLRDEDAASFRFTDTDLAWRYRYATLEQVREARAAFAASFGSCSFLEPVEDLRHLGLMPVAA